MTQMHALLDSRQAPCTSERASCVWRFVRRFRWWIAAPVLRPILREWEDTASNAAMAAKRTGAPRDWQIECIARSELNRVHAIEIEKAFGCTSFNEQHHYVRHYK